MKIIGIIERDRYICEVSHSEIEKHMGLYYGNMKTPTVGDVIDLGKGYDFAADVKSAMKKTSEFIESNKKIITAILNGVSVVGEVERAEAKAPEVVENA